MYKRIFIKYKAIGMQRSKYYLLKSERSDRVKIINDRMIILNSHMTF